MKKLLKKNPSKTLTLLESSPVVQRIRVFPFKTSSGTFQDVSKATEIKVHEVVSLLCFLCLWTKVLFSILKQQYIYPHILTFIPHIHIPSLLPHTSGYIPYLLLHFIKDLIYLNLIISFLLQ